MRETCLHSQKELEQRIWTPCLNLEFFLLSQANPKLHAQISYLIPIFILNYPVGKGFPDGMVVKNPCYPCRRHKRHGSIPGLGRFPGVGNCSSLQYSCLENSVGRGYWWAVVHGVTKSWTQLNAHAHTHRAEISKWWWFWFSDKKFVKWPYNRLDIRPKPQSLDFKPRDLSSGFLYEYALTSIPSSSWTPSLTTFHSAPWN